MRRREFISFLGGAAGWPLAAVAQQRSVPTIGYLYPGGEETVLVSAFRRGLSELGFVDGRNVTIDYRFGRNDPGRIPELLSDLAHRRVAAMAVTGGATGALAAKAVTTTIPIIFEIGDDPVANGLVASLNRPGGNLTGIAALNSDLDPKRLNLLTELVPTAKRIGVLLSNRRTSSAQERMRDLPTETAAALGRQIEVFVASDAQEIEDVFGTLAEKHVDALYITPSPLHFSLRAQIAAAAARHAIPVVYGERAMAAAGGLMSYGADTTDDWRMVGTYVGRILKGEKPADLPVQQPSKFEFVINLQTARLIGLSVPPSLLARADAVIE